MRCSQVQYFRSMFQGITIPKEVSPYHLRSLQLAIKIRDGFIPELHLHQRKLRKTKDVTRCYVTKFVRPTQPGFQCLHHCNPDDTIVTSSDIDLSDTHGRDISSIDELRNEYAEHAQCLLLFEVEIRSSILKTLPKELITACQIGILDEPPFVIKRRLTLPVKQFLSISGIAQNHAKVSPLKLLQQDSPCKSSNRLNGYLMKLRKIPAHEKNAVCRSVTEVACTGFLNYIPPSRFSKYMKSGYCIASCVFHHEYRAIFDILMNSGKSSDSRIEFDFPDIQTKKPNKSIKRRDSLLNLQRGASHAKSLIQSPIGWPTSVENSDDHELEKLFKESFDQETIQRWIRELSYMIWNMVVSRRVASHGSFQVLPGDIVYKNDEYIFLTDDDILSQKYTHLDILLPVPGADVSLPKNECALIYESVFEEFRLPKDMEKWIFPFVQRIPGAYRSMVVKPIDMSSKVVLDKVDLTVELSFRLPVGSFASMLVREISKLELNTPQDFDLDLNALGDSYTGSNKKTAENSVDNIKSRNMNAEQKAAYRKKYDPNRKKFTNSRTLHQARLLNVVYRGILPQGTQRWRKLAINGRI